VKPCSSVGPIATKSSPCGGIPKMTAATRSWTAIPQQPTTEALRSGWPTFWPTAHSLCFPAPKAATVCCRPVGRA